MDRQLKRSYADGNRLDKLLCPATGHADPGKKSDTPAARLGEVIVRIFSVPRETWELSLPSFQV